MDPHLTQFSRGKAFRRVQPMLASSQSDSFAHFPKQPRARITAVFSIEGQEYPRGHGTGRKKDATGPSLYPHHPTVFTPKKDATGPSLYPHHPTVFTPKKDATGPSLYPHHPTVFTPNDRQLTALLSKTASGTELLNLLVTHSQSFNSIHTCAAARSAVRLKEQQKERPPNSSRGVQEYEALKKVVNFLVLSVIGEESSVLSTAQPRELSGIAWALAKLRPNDMRPAQAVAKAIRFGYVRSFMEEAKPQSSTGYSVTEQDDESKSGNQPPAHKGRTQYRMERERLVPQGTTQYTCTPQSLVNLAWSLATWQHNDAAAVSVLLTGLLSQVHGMSPQDLSLAAWSFATLSRLPFHLPTTSATSNDQSTGHLEKNSASNHVVEQVVFQRSLLAAQMILIAKTFIQHGKPVWEEPPKHPTLCGFTPQGLSNLVWGLTQLACQDRAEGSSCATHVHAGISSTSAHVHAGISSTEIWQLICRISARSSSFSPSSGRGSTGHIQSQHSFFSHFKPQELSSLLVGLATLHRFSPPSPQAVATVRALAAAMAEDAGVRHLAYWPSQALSNTLWALAVMRVPCSKLLSQATLLLAQGHAWLAPTNATSSTASRQGARQPSAPAASGQGAWQPPAPAASGQGARQPSAPAASGQGAWQPPAPAASGQGVWQPSAPAASGQGAWQPPAPADLSPFASQSPTLSHIPKSLQDDHDMSHTLEFKPKEVAQLLWAISVLCLAGGGNRQPESAQALAQHLHMEDCMARLAREASMCMHGMDPSSIAMCAWACRWRRRKLVSEFEILPGDEHEELDDLLDVGTDDELWGFEDPCMVRSKHLAQRFQDREGFLIPEAAAQQVLVQAMRHLVEAGPTKLGPGPSSAVLLAVAVRLEPLYKPWVESREGLEVGVGHRKVLQSPWKIAESVITSTVSSIQSRVPQDVFSDRQSWGVKDLPVSSLVMPVLQELNGTSSSSSTSGGAADDLRSALLSACHSEDENVSGTRQSFLWGVSAPDDVGSTQISERSSVLNHILGNDGCSSATQPSIPQDSFRKVSSHSDESMEEVLGLTRNILDLVSEHSWQLSSTAQPRELACLAVACARLGALATQSMQGDQLPARISNTFPFQSVTQTPSAQLSRYDDGSSPGLGLRKYGVQKDSLHWVWQREPLFQAVATAATSSDFIRHANGPIIAAVAWAVTSAGFRCQTLFRSAAMLLCGQGSSEGKDSHIANSRHSMKGGSNGRPTSSNGRPTTLFPTASGSGMPSRQSGGVNKMAPRCLQKLLWAAAASGSYHQPLFDSMCSKLAGHVGRGVTVAGPSPAMVLEPGVLVDCMWSLAVVRHYDGPLIEAACRTLCSPLAASSSITGGGSLRTISGSSKGENQSQVPNSLLQQVEQDLATVTVSELLPPADLVKLMWSVGYLGAGVVKQWRPPLRALLEAVSLLDDQQAVVLLWSLAVQQLVLLGEEGGSEDDEEAMQLLYCLLDRLFLIPTSPSVSERSSSSDSDSLMRMAVPHGIVYTAAEALSWLLAGPKRKLVATTLREGLPAHLKTVLRNVWLGEGPDIAQGWLGEGPDIAQDQPAKVKGGETDPSLSSRGLQVDMGSVELSVFLDGDDLFSATELACPGIQSACLQLHLVLQSLGYKPEVVSSRLHPALPLLRSSISSANGWLGGLVSVPSAGRAVVVTGPQDFARNTTSYGWRSSDVNKRRQPAPSHVFPSNYAQEPLGPLFTSLQLLRASTGLHVSAVDAREWLQLQGLREQQLFVLKLLSQAGKGI
ncbi:hypothetical protein CEUSTIGMA_g8574.t1 [Chlamydomonas eustigma]|uniref:RAP domain-containing protein n=1 Tax=Chlamydomonas eustigma TaxID=1157962 RepID=A0A250XDM1_9CHLO|nr:hypothetical protein CEUSTIGMA_g8574.t1 [Chlamydomonas eustigma]|eukprot:GAX81141.1 hypothetical protein CEUSTIGMA_g8574.t1 [Chlamydomonas eustigma]